MIYYVNAKSTSVGRGTIENPFRTIQEAADIAMPGDEVVVLPGVYRESVNPVHGGTSDARIIYRSAEKGTAVITGAERIDTWEKAEGNVWKASVPNSLFTDAIVDTEHSIELLLEERDGQWRMKTNLAEYLPAYTVKRIDTDRLGMAFEPEQKFENPDGSPIVFNEDYFGRPTNDLSIAGPFAQIADEIILIDQGSKEI